MTARLPIAVILTALAVSALAGATDHATAAALHLGDGPLVPQAIERSERMLEKAQARIETLEKRMFWMQILGPIRSSRWWGWG